MTTNAETTKENRVFNRSIERSLRLWAGSILMVFVTSHLINHAIGLFGVEVMTEVQEWRVVIWHSMPGTVVLIGSVLIHIGLTLKRTLSRRTWRMPMVEALQLALGVLIPVMLAQHIVGTRVLQLIAGTENPYINLLRYLWPENALWQTLTLLVVWTHGVIGLYFAFHQRKWFKRFNLALLLAAILIPVLSLAGFVASGREALKLDTPPENWNTAQLAAYLNAMVWSKWIVTAFLAVFFVGIAIRFLQVKLGQTVTVRYTGHGEINSPKGMTLLEMSRSNQIPHPSACGGRGRCASCRVLILDGAEALRPPSGLEQKMLTRIRAPQRVRLACQIKPMADIAVRVLIASDTGQLGEMEKNIELDWGQKQILTILIADIRGFTSLSRHQLPTDLVVLLNRVIDEMTQATLGHNGLVAQVQTDGIMSVFGLGNGPKSGSRAAIGAAADMLKTVALINKEFGPTLPQPLRIGIGIHTGPVIVSRIGDAEKGYQLVVIGEPVDATSRLEDATKEMVADCIVSVETLRAAGLSTDGVELRQIHYKNGENPLSAAAFSEMVDLHKIMGVKPSKTLDRTPA